MKHRIKKILEQIYILPEDILVSEYNFLEPNKDNKYVCRRFKRELDARKKWGKVKFPLEVESHGLVYVMKCKQYYKIGITSDIRSRISTIRQSNPHKIKLVYCEYLDNYMEVEKELHHEYKKKHVRGEWYLLKNEDIEAIKNRTPSWDMCSKCRRVAKMNDKEVEGLFNK